jgi:hypothetical protein
MRTLQEASAARTRNSINMLTLNKMKNTCSPDAFSAVMSQLREFVKWLSQEAITAKIT